MAELAYEPTEWADFESGNTPITAAALNNMEGGIADAVAGVNTLDTKRLQTYRVSQDGDTATQDVSGNAIVGPCLIYDEAINGTYYEPSSDVGDRVLMVSANQIKALQDSVSQKVLIGLSRVEIAGGAGDSEPMSFRFYVGGSMHRSVEFSDAGIRFFDRTNGQLKQLWRMSGTK